MKIIVGVTMFNIETMIEKALDSIISQTYKNFVCYIIDDLSTDNSAQVVKDYIERTGDDRFILIQNKSKRYQIGNYDLICRDTEGVEDEDIFVEVDGDDWLADNKVFERVIDYYSKGDIWISNGSFNFSHGKKGFSAPVTDFDGGLRKKAFNATHLRTWKIFLWRAMDPKDLRNSNGDWWDASCDLIFMYDMLEMAGPDHYIFMPEVNYIYNGKNPLCEHYKFRGTQKLADMIKFAKNKAPRKRLIR